MKHFMALIIYWPASLNVPFLQTQTSYLEHFARDKKEKGLHSTFTVDDPKADFERDRATLPTEYLQKIRDKIINKNSLKLIFFSFKHRRQHISCFLKLCNC